jgi:hypothetical protein
MTSTYLLHHHELVHACCKRVAHAIDVIARKVHEHHLTFGKLGR